MNSYNDFSYGVGFKLGNGKKARFWKDIWSSYNTLGEEFLDLHSIVYKLQQRCSADRLHGVIRREYPLEPIIC